MSLKLHVTTILSVFSELTFDTTSREYDVIAKFSATAEKGFVQVFKGFNQDTSPQIIEQQLQHIIVGQQIQVTGRMEISSYVKNGASSTAVTIHATAIHPYNKIINQQWLDALPGTISKPKEKNVKAQMQEYLSTQDKAEKMAKNLESKLQNSDLATLLTPTPSSSDRNKKRPHEGDTHSTNDRGSKKKTTTNNRTSASSSKSASNDSSLSTSSTNLPASTASTTTTTRRTHIIHPEETADDQALRSIFAIHDDQMDITDQDQ
ncbi:hypothetical protein BG015_004248 [Linnemannia schmuckeri]|uniref:Uncharacterized protein n=1 Tax=Linnemannia schmuckeri TaxID=64567 RepID=A0A9P5V0W2_9FUNG|nr:hypothetical protein BG015_004248 [Linnemannia schmuckeri]